MPWNNPETVKLIKMVKSAINCYKLLSQDYTITVINVYNPSTVLDRYYYLIRNEITKIPQFTPFMEYNTYCFNCSACGCLFFGFL